MSPQLSARCLLAVLAAMLLASVLGLLAMEPVALSIPPQARGLGWRSIVPALGLGVCWIGFRWVDRLPRAEERHAWRAFFGASAAAALLSLLEPISSPLAWWLGRVAVGSAGAAAAMIFLAERLGPRWIAPRVVALVLLAGPIAAAVGLASQAVHGVADERLLIWLECAPLLLLPLGVWGLPTRGLRDGDWFVALGFFAAAKLFDVLDGRIDAVAALDGHLLADIGLAASVAWLACALWRQSAAAELSAPAREVDPSLSAPSARARNTSAKTSA